MSRAKWWTVLFNCGLWGLSVGCGGTCSTKISRAKTLPREGGDVEAGGQRFQAVSKTI